jgi:hypothetical protein
MGSGFFHLEALTMLKGTLDPAVDGDPTCRMAKA